MVLDPITITSLGILVLVAMVVTLSVWYPGWRDRRIISRPFPQNWLAILQEKLPFLHRLTSDEQRQLKQNIQRFVAGKRFHGCAGLQVTDEMRITIAAQACLLLLNRDTGVYPRLKHILVYPDAFVSNQEDIYEDGTVDMDREVRLGESWHYGKVILSWDDIRHGIRNFQDGHNVVLHEFSHQLDSESGSANGAPLLHTNSYATWASVLSKEFEDLNEDFAHHHESVMDYYGATNPAEFFAVATETFFEKPRQMRREHPELYELLRNYYAVDPTTWV